MANKLTGYREILFNRKPRLLNLIEDLKEKPEHLPPCFNFGYNHITVFPLNSIKGPENAF